jgi:hypothetical protein
MNHRSILGLVMLLTGNVAGAAECTRFEWASVTAGELSIDQGAVIVAVDIEGVGTNLPMQLDTGSARTELYGEAVASDVQSAGTRTRVVSIRGWSDTGSPVPVVIRPPSGPPGRTAGTLGTDALSNGFVLDLERERLCKPSRLSDPGIADWQALTLANGSPVLEAVEAGTTIRLLLDTGSSGFTLLSTPNLSSTVRTATPVRQLAVPSFGRLLNVSQRRPSGTLTVMGKALQLDTVYGLDDADVEAMLKSQGLAGLLGMRPFAAGALAFDLPGRRIGFGRLQQ